VCLNITSQKGLTHIFGRITFKAEVNLDAVWVFVEKLIEVMLNGLYG
jgi:hypothetical protein